MLLDGAFQLAWVTRDLDAAIGAFALRLPDASFSRHAIDLPCAGRTDNCVARIGVAWRGQQQIELIEPVAGAVELYRDALPPDGQVAAFHHVGIKVTGDEDAWHSRRASLVEDGSTIALEGGEAGRVRFAYFDLRAALGHFVELIWLNGPFLTRAPADGASALSCIS